MSGYRSFTDYIKRNLIIMLGLFRRARFHKKLTDNRLTAGIDGEGLLP